MTDNSKETHVEAISQSNDKQRDEGAEDRVGTITRQLQKVRSDEALPQLSLSSILALDRCRGQLLELLGVPFKAIKDPSVPERKAMERAAEDPELQGSLRSIIDTPVLFAKLVSYVNRAQSMQGVEPGGRN